MLGKRGRSSSDPVDFRTFEPQMTHHHVNKDLTQRPPRNLAKHFKSRDPFSYEQEVYLSVRLNLHSWKQLLSNPLDTFKGLITQGFAWSIGGLLVSSAKGLQIGAGLFDVIFTFDGDDIIIVSHSLQSAPRPSHPRLPMNQFSFP